MQPISIRNQQACCVIDIEGTIGVPEEWQFEHPDQRVATYERFRETVQRLADIQEREVVVNIRSTGGDVNDALLILEALRSTGAHITTRCYGYTASAATLIAQAASEGCREISSGALYLIHNAICAVEGNAEELEAQCALLRKTDERLAALYAERSGGEQTAFSSLMAENNGRGRWLSPEEVIRWGLADRVIGASETQPEESIEEPTEQKTEEAPTSSDKPQNLLHGWRRLLAALRSPKEPTPTIEDRNLWHRPEEFSSHRSLIALQAGQQQTIPTRCRPSEEPSLRERLRSSNEAAYEADLASLKR